MRAPVGLLHRVLETPCGERVSEWQILEASIAGRDVARESRVFLKDEEVEEQTRTRNEAPLSLTHWLIL